MPGDASVWIPDARAPSLSPLSGDVVSDVVVVGAGISGLMTAALVQRAAQDYIAVDDIPYVGRQPLRRRTWIAAGYRKWGLSNAAAAAIVLAASIDKQAHPWRSLFDPGRVGGHRGVARLVRDNLKVGGHLLGDWLGRLRTQRVDSLVPGQGGVIRHNGRITGAVHGVSLTCTHLGCTVRWNAAEDHR